MITYTRINPDGVVVEEKIITKTIEEMNYEELQAEGRRRQAECGGCNQRPDED